VPTFSFTNNNGFGVVLYVVPPGGTQETRQGAISPRTELPLAGDFPAGTDWRIRDSTDGSLIDIYRATSDSSQSHVIQDYRQIQIALRLQNNTPSHVYVYIVDPVSKTERLPVQLNRALHPGEMITLNYLRPLFPNTEIRFKQAGGLLGISAQTLIQTYLTTAEPSQNYVIYPPAPEVVTPVVITGGTVIYSGPIENQPLDPKTHTPPIAVWSAQRSIFNAASYTLELGMFEWSIRQRTNLLDANADKNAIRAALYAGLMAIATATSRTDKEKAIMDWLADQIKKARISAAQLALQEYYRWNADPWSYNPPAGFTPYLLTPRNSPEWLTGAPYPPALDYESLISFAADIVSNNGWSPLNNPILQQGQPGSSSLVGVVGFPSYGAALAYKNLYTSDSGVTALAYTTANLFSPINLSPLPPGVAAPLASLKVMNLQNIGPYTYRSLQDLAKAIIKSSGGLADVPMPVTVLKLEGLEVSELRAALNDILEAEVLGSFVCTLTLSIAIQALIDQIILLAELSRLEQILKDEVAKQQSAPRPDLGNLLYNDINNIIQVYAPDYQPTDPVLLERLMGRQEVYRAFLLSTIS
jgi:hypothetical protein